MNILYLHGLMSNNQSPKIDWLKELGHTVHNPDLKYQEDSETIFFDLEQLCDLNRIDLIIGSSMGGHLGFHLGNKYGIQTLLFNPSLADNEIAKPDVTCVENNVVLHTVVLGANDDVVIPSDTMKYLKDSRSNFVHIVEENGHRTPIEIFQKHFKLMEQKTNS
jgi:hypothetical protein